MDGEERKAYISVRFSVKKAPNLDYGAEQHEIEVPYDYDEAKLFAVVREAIKSQGI